MSARNRPWTFITGHGIVILYLAACPESTVRKISDDLFITERQVARIIKQLADEGIIQVRRTGLQNSYVVNHEARLRQPAISNLPVRQFIEALSPFFDRLT